MKTTTKKKPTKKANAAKPKVDDSTLVDRERTHYLQIRSLETTCDRLEGEYEAAKSSAAAAKSLWTEAVARLRECIRRGPDQQLPLPMGDGAAAAAGDFMKTDVMDAFPTLTGTQIELLDDAGIRTVQQLEDRRAGAGLRSIKGIGEAKAYALEDMLLDFIAKHRMEASKAPAADVVDEDDQDGDA
jgi:hypothetical protein